MAKGGREMREILGTSRCQRGRGASGNEGRVLGGSEWKIRGERRVVVRRAEVESETVLSWGVGCLAGRARKAGGRRRGRQAPVLGREDEESVG